MSKSLKLFYSTRWIRRPLIRFVDVVFFEEMVHIDLGVNAQLTRILTEDKMVQVSRSLAPPGMWTMTERKLARPRERNSEERYICVG
jgi:hypothetical protein